MPKSKSKKRKLAHTNTHPYTNSNTNSNKKYNSTTSNLTQEEIWDDSALLRSWNEAVAEYEFYHSIHAKGEDVDEVLKRHQVENGEDDVSGLEQGEIEDGEVNEDGINEVAIEDEGQIAPPPSHGVDLSLPGSTKIGIGNITINTDSDTTPHQPHSRPVLSTDQAQTLENIKMAYYWAGYYSGLYDGQQQQQAQAQAPSNDATLTATTSSVPVPPPTQEASNEEDELEEGEV